MKNSKVTFEDQLTVMLTFLTILFALITTSNGTFWPFCCGYYGYYPTFYNYQPPSYNIVTAPIYARVAPVVTESNNQPYGVSNDINPSSSRTITLYNQPRASHYYQRHPTKTIVEEDEIIVKRRPSMRKVYEETEIVRRPSVRKVYEETEIIRPSMTSYDVPFAHGLRKC
uniref:Uncharacterized protein n=1 Tax=Rhabditophanes sp. KR3021 TaxID=114890 RepID=A0AC35UGS8_9BILA